ncbi:hypothetical protein [Pseudomonas sp. Z3-8]|uniref:hypothetical protein n=1 Tax=Pseudomonas sp. Z3-8 TaxID=2817412 RepID=UPI003DA88C53
MKSTSLISFFGPLLLLHGCASLPDAKIGYYAAWTTVKVTATRTVACSAQDDIHIATDVSPSTSQAASNSPNDYHELDLKKLGGVFSDASVKIERTEDGRLKSWNSSTTGRGEEIVKSVLSLTSVLSGGVIKSSGTHPDICNLITQYGKNGTLSLTYSVILDPDQKELQALKADPTSNPYTDDLANSLPPLAAQVLRKLKSDIPIVNENTAGKIPVLHARQPGRLNFKVIDPNSNMNASYWSGSVLVAQLGEPYEIPIPTPRVFGKLTLSTSFSESGSLNSLEYIETNGSASFFNSLSALSKSTASDTTAENLAQAKNEADLIVQQQRLVLCKSSPSTCK